MLCFKLKSFKIIYYIFPTFLTIIVIIFLSVLGGQERIVRRPRLQHVSVFSRQRTKGMSVNAC